MNRSRKKFKNGDLGSKMPYLLNFGDHKNFLKNRLHQFYEIIEPWPYPKTRENDVTDGRADRKSWIHSTLRQSWESNNT